MPTVLITGASGGIGHELAKLFARDRHNLILVARGQDKLAQVAAELEANGITVKTVALDLAQPAAARNLFDQLQSDRITIDILVNNAGFGVLGEFAQMGDEEILGQIHLNITALTELTRLVLPQMIARRSGRILNVASTAGFQPGPLMAVYYATKAYVISFSEAVANELRNSGVTVTCFCPGATATGFAARAGNDKSRLFRKFGAMSSSKVALGAYRALMEGRTLAISGTQNWMLAQSVRFSPRKLVTAISRWVNEAA
jgi:uncharacterized protein